jgi:hypothetical protein
MVIRKPGYGFGFANRFQDTSRRSRRIRQMGEELFGDAVEGTLQGAR